MRTFNVPIDHPIIQNLTEHDLSFIEWSTALDDPKLREKIENTVYDDDFDEWYKNCMDEETEYTDESEEKSIVEDIEDDKDDKDDKDDENYEDLLGISDRSSLESDEWEEVE